MRPKDTPLTPSCDLLMPPLWRSMRGLMGRPALRSASPCRNIWHAWMNCSTSEFIARWSRARLILQDLATYNGLCAGLPLGSPPPPASAPISGEHAWDSPNGRDRRISGSSEVMGREFKIYQGARAWYKSFHASFPDRQAPSPFLFPLSPSSQLQHQAPPLFLPPSPFHPSPIHPPHT